MPLRNRVTPLGELVADPARGLVYGNRGCLHDDTGRIRRRYAGRRWIACRLEFQGWRRAPLLQPGRFTELFFLDEATAFAAGHRPCALCRRADYDRFGEIWRGLHPGRAGADEIDAQLHEERIEPATGVRRLHVGAFGDLPDGAFVLHDGTPHLVLGTELLRWTPAGYAGSKPRPGEERATLITPPSLLNVLHADREPLVPPVHPSASPPAARSRLEGRTPAHLPAHGPAGAPHGGAIDRSADDEKAQSREHRREAAATVPRSDEATPHTHDSRPRRPREF